MMKLRINLIVAEDLNKIKELNILLKTMNK